MFATSCFMVDDDDASFIGECSTHTAVLLLSC
jgi:hypothetical protein